MSDLLARLIAAGTPADLVAEVAMEIAQANVVRNQEAAQAARKEQQRADNARRQREWKERQRAAVMSGNGDNALPALVTVTGVTDASLSPSPNENNSNPQPHTHPENIPVREEPAAHVVAWAAFQAAKASEIKGSKVKSAHQIPADWKPILTDRAQKIVDDWPPGRFEQELEAFRDHAADKGRTSKDWQAAFRTWIVKSNAWNPKNERSSPVGRPSAPHSARDHRDEFEKALDRRIFGDLGFSASGTA